MLKLKRLIPALLSVIFAFAIFASACDSSEDDFGKEPADKEALVNITIDYSDAQRNFTLGDEFNSDNLVVMATMKDITTDATKDPIDVSKDAVVDSSNYNANKVGRYNIYVLYTHAGVERSASYTVNVRAKEPDFGGITVEYAQGFVNEVHLSYGQQSVEIKPELIVKKVDDKGVVSDTALSESEYDVSLYLGTVKQSSWTVGGGAYEIRATLKSDPKVFSGVSYYVVDKLSAFEWNSNAAGTQKDIDQWSSDKQVNDMAKTWNFTATYLSGKTKTVTVTDEGVSYECNVEEANAAKDITVNYSDYNALGDEEKAVATVTIKVNEIQAETHDYTYSYSLLQETITALGDPLLDKTTKLKAEYFAGANSFLKFVDSGKSDADQYRNDGSNTCIEIKGGRFEVTFQGKGYIIIGFSSTGGGQDSGIALMDKDGNYVYGTPEGTGAVELLADDENGNLKGLFVVTGTTEGKVKFSVEEAGTYTIYSWFSHSSGSRGCRLKSIQMKDVIIAGGNS